jgi:hypothetical protein
MNLVMSDFTREHQTTSSDETSTDGTTRRLGLSTTQVIASALAAISSAVAASYLGVAGTVLGAGFGSIVATISTALYQHSLTRTNERLKRVVPAAASEPVRNEPAVRNGAAARNEAAAPNEAAVRNEAGAPSKPAAPGTPARNGPARAFGQAPWVRIAAAAAGVFVFAIGSIAVFEQFAGGSLSSVVRGTDRHGTTLGELARPEPAQGPSTVTPSPSSTPSQPPSPSTTATPSAPMTAPPVTTPATPPTSAPTTPPATPTTEPEPSTSPSAR